MMQRRSSRSLQTWASWNKQTSQGFQMSGSRGVTIVERSNIDQQGRKFLHSVCNLVNVIRLLYLYGRRSYAHLLVSQMRHPLIEVTGSCDTFRSWDIIHKLNASYKLRPRLELRGYLHNHVANRWGYGQLDDRVHDSEATPTMSIKQSLPSRPGYSMTAVDWPLELLDVNLKSKYR